MTVEAALGATADLGMQLNNIGHTLLLAGAGRIYLQNGTITGGTVAGATLNVLNGELDGVKVENDLNVTQADSQLRVADGLTLNGTIHLVGHPPSFDR